MATNTIVNGIKARDNQVSAKSIAMGKFSSIITGAVSAQYIGFTKTPVIAAVCGLDFESPVVSVVLQLNEINDVLTKLFEQGASVLFTADGDLYKEGSSAPEAISDIDTLIEIIKTVSSIPGAPEDFPDKLNAFVNTLSEFEIVIPSDTASLEKPEIDANAASADGFIPECTEYKDVQELLFADPIHDVEEDKGWSPE